MGVSRFVVVSISLLLIVGVIIGVVVVNKQTSKRDGGNGGSPPSATSNKMVDALCAPTKYKETCHASVLSVATKPNASPKEYLTSVLETLDKYLKKVTEITHHIKVNKNDDPFNDESGIEGCKEFLGYAAEELESSLNAISTTTTIENIQDRANEFRNWLTGIYVYTETCVDQLDKPEYKDPVKAAMKNATEVTKNSLTIFAKFPDIIKNMGLSLKFVNPSRRLLGTNEMARHDNDRGLPSWITSADRKLLASHHVPRDIIPNAVVAKDGSGQFRTINEAIASIPMKSKAKFIIYVKAGVYNEVIIIKKLHNVTIYGDGIGKTIVTGSLNHAGLNGKPTVKTSETATIGVDAEGFMIMSMTVENTAGPAGHQAVALRINGNRGIGYRCEFRGYQDTLYYHRGDQFFKECMISGTVDFIFGMGKAIIQDSTIIVRKPNPNQSNMVTADGGTNDALCGLVIQNCRIIADKELLAQIANFKTFLGRPWKDLAKTIFIQNDIGGFIAPQGYTPFATSGEDADNHFTAIYGEYNNFGPGSNTANRDGETFKGWKVLNYQEADKFTIRNFLQAEWWLAAQNMPFKRDL